MKFFSIKSSLDNKIVGDYNQVQKAIHNCDIWNEPNFIDRIDFIKIDFEPLLSSAVLAKNAKLTDLISASVVGFSSRLLISGKLKILIEKYSQETCQFFKSPVIFKNTIIENYWILHPYKFNLEVIDFKNSVIYETQNVFLKILKLSINSIEEFYEAKSKIDNKGREFGIFIERIKIRDHVLLDFFILRYVEAGVKFIVSEKLKWELEEADCTGIEFQPVELSLGEWLHGGEREKIYGKV